MPNPNAARAIAMLSNPRPAIDPRFGQIVDQMRQMGPDAALAALRGAYTSQAPQDVPLPNMTGKIDPRLQTPVPIGGRKNGA